jgi:hypothetical protein
VIAAMNPGYSAAFEIRGKHSGEARKKFLSDHTEAISEELFKNISTEMECRLAGVTAILQKLEDAVAYLPTVVKAICSDLNTSNQISLEDKQSIIEAIQSSSAETLEACNHKFHLISY